MTRKKRQVTLTSSATIKCPHCGKNSRIKLEEKKFVGNLECKKCGNKIETPPAYCCVVCAFSKKKCLQSLILEAKMKGLEIKREEKKQEKISIEPGKPVLLIDEKIINNSKKEI